MLPPTPLQIGWWWGRARTWRRLEVRTDDPEAAPENGAHGRLIRPVGDQGHGDALARLRVTLDHGVAPMGPMPKSGEDRIVCRAAQGLAKPATLIQREGRHRRLRVVASASDASRY